MLSTKVLIIVISILISICVYQYRRKKLYALSNKLKGPMALPIIGSAYLFLGLKSDGKINKKKCIYNVHSFKY